MKFCVPSMGSMIQAYSVMSGFMSLSSSRKAASGTRGVSALTSISCTFTSMSVTKFACPSFCSIEERVLSARKCPVSSTIRRTFPASSSNCSVDVKSILSAIVGLLFQTARFPAILTGKRKSYTDRNISYPDCICKKENGLGEGFSQNAFFWC